MVEKSAFWIVIIAILTMTGYLGTAQATEPPARDADWPTADMRDRLQRFTTKRG